MYKHLIKWIQVGLFLGLMSTATYAESAISGVGSIAGEFVSPISIAGNALVSGAMIIGLLMVFAGFVRYRQHKINPLAHPISTIMVLVVLGIILICFPLMYQLQKNVEKVVPPAQISGVTTADQR